MPQFDKISFFNQIFWLFFFFSGFYLIFLKIFLPKLSSVLKARAKKLQKGSGGVVNFVEEQILVTENFSFSIEQTSFVVKDSVTDSIEKINFWITSRFSTINKENLSVSNEVMEIILHNKIKMLYFMEILLQEIMQRPSKKSVAFYFL